MRFAVLFPGQGSQKIGMGLDLLDKTNLARALFDKVDNITERKISEIFLYGPENELNQTKNTQVSIVVISVLLTLLLKDELKKKNLDFSPSACCGHSLGEFTALWFSGLFSLEDLIKIVSIRGNLMQNAPPGSMAAVLNLTKEQIESLLNADTFKNKIVIANYNTPTQLVISGEKIAIDDIVPKIKSLGGKAIVLPVGGAFHSPLMNVPSSEFTREFDKLQITSNATIPIFQNVDGKPSTDVSLIKEKIKKHSRTFSRFRARTMDAILERGNFFYSRISKTSRMSISGCRETISSAQSFTV
jgi:[acyl-carrier-protein] S-malonyltransferase